MVTHYGFYMINIIDPMLIVINFDLPLLSEKR